MGFQECKFEKLHFWPVSPYCHNCGIVRNPLFHEDCTSNLLQILFLKFGLDFYRKLFSAGDERFDQTGERSRNSGRALLYDLGRQRTQRTKGLRSTALTIFY